MSSIRKFLCLCLPALLLCSANPKSAEAAVRLAPVHLYTWAHRGDTEHLRVYHRYINLQDKNNNTALCLAQQNRDRDAYILLLQYGASTDVECHNDDDPICAVVTATKTKISPAAGWWLLGAGAVGAAAYLIADSDDSKSKKCPTGYEKDLKDCSAKTHPDGWEYTSSGSVKGKPCGACHPKQCEIGKLSCESPIRGLELSAEENGKYAGNSTCYNCIYTCQEGYYTSETSCTDGGYICNSVTQADTTCWWRTGSQQCPADYPTEVQCQTGTGYVNNEKSTRMGDRTCFSCDYQCDTANNWETSCQAGKVCEQINMPNGNKCYKVSGCPADFPYTTEQVCRQGGWNCQESAPGSNCWKHISDQTCAEYENGAFPTTGRCPAPATGIILTEDYRNVGDNTICSKCAYACDTVNNWVPGACPAGRVCDVVNNPDGGVCHKDNGCPAEYSITDELACKNNSSGAVGYRCEESASGSGCWKQITEIDCPTTHTKGLTQCTSSPYDTGTLGWQYDQDGYSGEDVCGRCTKLACNYGFSEDIQSAADCGSTNENGWFISQDTSRYAGNKACNKCEPNPCLDNSIYTTYDTPTGLKLLNKNAHGYHGNDTCYWYEFECNELQGYYEDETNCTQNTGTGNQYTCTRTEFNDLPTQTGTHVCYRRGTENSCAAVWTGWSETACEQNPKTGVVLANDNHRTLGTKDCYKCEYKCDEENNYETSCPSGMTCTPTGGITVPNSTTKCYLPTGCDTANGWTNTCPAGTTCEERSIAGLSSLKCYKPTGCEVKYVDYNKTNAEQTACTSVGGAYSSTYSGQTVSGNPLNCGTCSCPTDKPYTYNAYQHCIDVATRVYGSSTGIKATQSSHVSLPGMSTNDYCYGCSFSCDEDNGYYTKTVCNNKGAGYNWNRTTTIGDLQCGTCEPKTQCPENSYTTTDTLPTPPTGFKYTIDTNSIKGYIGDTPCYGLTISCANNWSLERKYPDLINYESASLNGDSPQTVVCYRPTACKITENTTSEEECRNRTGNYIYNELVYDNPIACGSCQPGACNTGYTIETEANCSVGSTWTANTAQGGYSGEAPCGSCVTNSCPENFKDLSTNNDANDCGDTGSNGYTWTQDPAHTRGEGGKYCGRCDEIACKDNSIYTTYETPTGLKLLNKNAHGYHGNDTCYLYEFECNELQGYYEDETDCTGNTGSGNQYTCTPIDYTNLPTQTTTHKCYYRGTENSCAAVWEGWSETACEQNPKTGVVLANDNHRTLGTKDCYKCEYKCDEENNYETSCPSGMTCTPTSGITVPNSTTKCYLPTGCDTANGWTNTCPAGTTCEERSIAGLSSLKCYKPTGCEVKYVDYNKTNAEQTACTSVGGAYSSTYSGQTVSGNPLNCGTCSCPTDKPYTYNTYEHCIDVATRVYGSSTGIKATQSSHVSLPGMSTNDYCYGCSFSCDEDNGYYTETVCNNKGAGYNWNRTTTIGDLQCGTCTYGCSASRGEYTTQQECEVMDDHGWIYTCSQDTTTNCWKQTDKLKQCTEDSGYPYESCANAMTTEGISTTYFDYTEFRSHDPLENGDFCYACRWKCKSPYKTEADCDLTGYDWEEKDTASNSEGSVTCGTCVPHQCIDGYATEDDPLPSTPSGFKVELDTTQQEPKTSAGHPCYLIVYNCDEAAGFAEEQDCLNANSGYTCKPHTYKNVTCYMKDDPDACNDGFSTDVTSCTSPNTDAILAELDNDESKPKSGNLDCNRCVYSCITPPYHQKAKSAAIRVSLIFDYYITPQSFTTTSGVESVCYKANRCKSENDYQQGTDLSACGDHPEGYQSATPDEADGISCIKCTPKTSCDEGSASCPTYDKLKLTSTENGSYMGETPCYNCSYNCDMTLGSYPTGRVGQTACQQGTNYKFVCEEQTFGPTGSPVTCNVKTKILCPDTQQESACINPSTTYFVQSTESHNISESGLSNTCYSCSYTCKSPYTTENDCNLDAYDWDEKQSVENSDGTTTACGTCTPKTCNTTAGYTTDYSTGAKTCVAPAETTYVSISALLVQDTSIPMSGTNKCEKCEMGCLLGYHKMVSQMPSSTSHSLYISPFFSQTNDTVKETICYKATGCNEESNYKQGTTLSDCGTAAGYESATAVLADGISCIKCDPRACNTGYTTQVDANCAVGSTWKANTAQGGYSGEAPCGSCVTNSCPENFKDLSTNNDANDCGDTGSNGYTWTQDPAHTRGEGGKYCGRCDEIACKDNSIYTTYETPTGLKLLNKNAHGYHGNDTCYLYEFECNELQGYYEDETDCTGNTGSGNQYTCTPIDYTNLPTQTTTHKCYYRGTENSCAAVWTGWSETACEQNPKTGVVLANDNHRTLGTKDCYKCEYACDTANNYETSCPSGMTCTPTSGITVPNSTTKCYLPTGCATPNVKEADCDTDAYDYEPVIEKNNISCGTCTPKTCNTTAGYTTDYSTGAKTCVAPAETTYISIVAKLNQDTLIPMSGTNKCEKCDITCATGYHKLVAQMPATPVSHKLYTSPLFSQTNGTTKDTVCYKATACATGYKQGTTLSDCGTAAGYKTATAVTIDNISCIKCDPKACNTGYYTATSTQGQNCATGYAWSADTTNGGYSGESPCGKCVLSSCPTGYYEDRNSYIENYCNSTRANLGSRGTANYDDNGGTLSNGNKCAKCNVDCTSPYEGTTTYPNNTIFDFDISVGFTRNYPETTTTEYCVYPTGCKNSNNYYTQSDCEAKGAGYKWKSTDIKRYDTTSYHIICALCEVVSCNSGYYTETSTQGQNCATGYVWSADTTNGGYSGDAPCGKCVLSSCPAGYREDNTDTNIQSYCNTKRTALSGMGTARYNTNGTLGNGNSCANCTINCNTSDGYHGTTTLPNNRIFNYITSTSFASPYPIDTNEDEYCVKVNGCQNNYYLQSACTAKGTGYKWSSSASFYDTTCGTCEPIPCPGDEVTDPVDCGGYATNAWYLELSGAKSGDDNCGVCTPIPCDDTERGRSAYATDLSCATIANMQKTDTPTNYYSGNDLCHVCEYECKSVTDDGTNRQIYTTTTDDGGAYCRSQSGASSCEKVASRTQAQQENPEYCWVVATTTCPTNYKEDTNNYIQNYCTNQGTALSGKATAVYNQGGALANGNKCANCTIDCNRSSGYYGTTTAPNTSVFSFDATPKFYSPYPIDISEDELCVKMNGCNHDNNYYTRAECNNKGNTFIYKPGTSYTIGGQTTDCGGCVSCASGHYSSITSVSDCVQETAVTASLYQDPHGCGRCSYSCNIAQGYYLAPNGSYSYCPKGFTCINSVNTTDSIGTVVPACYKVTGCSSGYEEENYDTDIFEVETYSYWRHNADYEIELDCSNVIGCNPPYVESSGTDGTADCSETHPEGYTWQEVGYADSIHSIRCGECLVKSCPTYTGSLETGVLATNVPTYTTTCPTSPSIYLTFTRAFNTSSYSGEYQCKVCIYACNNDNGAYSTSSACKDGDKYNCEEVITNGYRCYVRQSNCPEGYHEVSNDPFAPRILCSALFLEGTEPAIDATTVTTSGTGGVTCEKCVYSCASGYTESSISCPTGFTCNSDVLPGSDPIKYCFKATGCDTSGTTIYASSNTGCGDGQHASGWQLNGEKTYNGVTCGKCLKRNCQPWGGTESTQHGWGCNYTVIGFGDATQITTSPINNNFSGDDQCYYCQFECEYPNTSTGYNACMSVYGGCKTLTINGTTCYVPNSFDEDQPETTDDLPSNRMTLLNTVKRSVTTAGDENVEVIRSSDNIENAVDEEYQTSGMIEIIHNSTGRAVGIYGENGNSIINRNGASVNIENNAGGVAIGIYSEQGGSVTNEGEIKIADKDQTGTAIGIYGEGGNTIVNAETGIIDVSGKDAYGIYVEDGNGTLVENRGAIYASGANAHGIYIAESADNSTVLNTGSIFLNGTEKGDAGITLNGGTLRNASLVKFDGAADLNTLGGLVYLEDGGVYEAESLSGDLKAGVSNVLGGNKDTYVAENALQAEDIESLNVASESAMFEAKTQANNAGGNDVVLERKSFAEVSPNKSIANYLEKNYAAGNMEEMYNEVKAQTTADQAQLAAAKNLGYDVLPNFADENYLALKSLNRTISESILEPTEEVNRVLAGADSVSLETDNKGLLSGYDTNASSMYTFGDKRLNNWNRLGLGLSITKLSSSYDRGGDRDLNIFNVFVPYMHKFSDNLRLASIFNVGYGNGKYDRGSDRESDITDIFYGWTNELRYTMDLNGFAELEPALMLNAIGYTEDGFDEDAADGIKSRKTHNMSVEAGFGLFLKKKVSLEKYGRLGFRIGGAYYRELGDPYDEIEAQRKGSTGWYKINDYANIYDHDRAVLEAAVDYEYKRLSLYAKYNQILLKRNKPQMLDAGIKYNF